jgi:hypothetical protein
MEKQELNTRESEKELPALELDMRGQRYSILGISFLGNEVLALFCSVSISF